MRLKPSKDIKKIVILGAGFAGLHIFYKIRHLIGKKIDVTVIDAKSHSLLKPSLPEVSFEGAPISHSLVELQHSLESRGATFICDEVVNINAKENELTLKQGVNLGYDYLFLATGAIKDYDAIQGYREFGYSVCDDIEAQKLWKKVQTFEGGKIVTGAAKSSWGTRVDAPPLLAPCEGPIGEIMFMLDYYLTHEKAYKRMQDYSIEVFTPGEIFFEDVGDAPRDAIGKIMQERKMQLFNQKVLTEITKDSLKFEDGTTIACDLAIVIPPYSAPKVLLSSKLGDEKGFIPTDKEMRHLDYKNIFAAGDITALAQPKLGHVAIIQGAIAAATLMKELGEEIAIPAHELEVFCIMNMGGHDATLIASDILYGGKRDIVFHSPLAKMMKWGFDSYLYYNKGHMPPDFALDATDKLVGLL
ncbi:NAD(P)/FAD-dependent oxidoreductase [Sulfurimonas sp.]